MKNELIELTEIMENIEAFRKKNKVTRSGLSVAVGLKSNTLNVLFHRIKKGRMPSIDIYLLYRIADALDCSVCELLGEKQ